MAPSPPPALLATRASPTTTTPITPATTCDHLGIYALPQIVGDEPQNKTLLRDASIFAVPNWNESLVGMTACCGGSNTENHNINTENEGVYVGGPEKCELWCLIPDEFLYENGTDDRNGNDAKKRNPGSVAASLMESCVKREGNITEDFITIWQVKDAEGSAAAWRGKMSMKMVVTGVVGWGVMLGGLFA